MGSLSRLFEKPGHPLRLEHGDDQDQRAKDNQVHPSSRAAQ
jgi:hypothetical protein